MGTQKRMSGVCVDERSDTRDGTGAKTLTRKVPREHRGNEGRPETNVKWNTLSREILQS